MTTALAVVPATSGPERILEGGCCAWPLPADATCADVARHRFGEVAAAIGVSGGLAEDGIVMAGELAANTLYARENIEFDGISQQPETGCAEIWLYIRGAGAGAELVCKVFDSQRGWQSGVAPDPVSMRTHGAPTGAVPVEREAAGHGLPAVAALSGGRWGHHLTRARLGTWKVPGKVVWFALPMPAGCVPARPGSCPRGPHQAAAELAAMIADRRLGDRLVRADEPVAGVSVLSISCGLTVWCRGGIASWQARSGGYERRSFADLVEVAEQIVCAHEEIEWNAERPAADDGARCRPGPGRFWPAAAGG